MEKKYYKVYIVNWKETTLGEENILETECGTCDFAFKTEDEAIAKVKELAEGKVRECVDELEYEPEEVAAEYNDNGDFCCVNAGSNTYEYSVYAVFVDI